MDVGAKGEAEASVERVVENIGGLNVAGKTFCVGLEGLDVRDTSKNTTSTRSLRPQIYRRLT